MYLRKIIISNFKNIADAELEFSGKFNSVLGDNGEGKTNLLDAVHYLSLTKSCFSRSDRYVIRTGEAGAALGGTLVNGDEVHRISVSIDSGGVKQLKKDGKLYSKISDYIGTVPAVMVSPYDSELVNDPGEARRRFMDLMLSQTDREYLYRLQSYNRVLAQRNSLLKEDSPSDDLLMTFASRLSSFGQYIFEARRKMCDTFSGPVSDYYRDISGGSEQVSLRYVSQLSESDLESQLAASLERDKYLQYTTRGVQRDDMDFLMDGCGIRRFGSQGQQKSFLVALKLAQFSVMKDHCGFSPILLLDDLFDRLDPRRVERLVSLVASDRFGQVFITDSGPERISSVIKASGTESAAFSVRSGAFKRIG